MKNSLILVMALLCFNAFAADPPDGASDGRKDETANSKPYQETIVVTATRTERKVDDLPVSVTVIDRKEIETAPARSLDDLLRTVPGVTFPVGSVRNYSPSQNELSMRGLGGDRALVMLDGIPLNDPYGAFIQWKKVPQEEISQVEVVRGGNSSLFGNYALGGTINLLTRPSFESSTGINASWGSQNTARIDVDLDHRIRDGWGIGANILNFSTDGYIRTAPESRGAADIKANTHTTIASLRTDWVTPSGAAGWVRANNFDDFIRLGTRLTWWDHDIFDLATGMSWAFGQNSVSARAFYQNQTEIGTGGRVDSTRSVETLSLNNDVSVKDLGGTFQWTRTIGPRVPSVSFGFDVHQLAMSDVRDFYNSSGGIDVTIDDGGSQRFSGLFGMVSWTPATRIEILASARIDSYRTFDGIEHRSTGEVTHFDERSSTQLNPRLSARLALNDTWALRGAAYRAFRAPTMRDMYRQSTVARRDTIANPDLGPETMRGGEIGLTYSRGGLFGEITAFANEVDDLITDVFVATTPRQIRQAQNLGASRSRGIETVLNWRISPSWLLTGGYSYTDAEITSNPDDPTLVGNRVPTVPRNAGSLSVRWFSPSGFAATVRGRSESFRWFDAGNRLPYGGATVVDLLASWPVRDRIEIFAIAENVFDEQYLSDRAATDRLGDPRSINVGVRLRLPGF